MAKQTDAGKDQPKGEAKAVEPKVGDQVNLVLADGTVEPVKLVALAKSGLATIERDDGQVISSSPNDPAGKQPDSWHVAAAE